MRYVIRQRWHYPLDAASSIIWFDSPVTDTGSGIPKEYHERIFEKFYQVAESGPKGTGLGLYIAKEIVRAHGGEIGVESELGNGSLLVYLTLMSKCFERSPAMTESKSRILVADDERNIRKNLAMVLEAAGYWSMWPRTGRSFRIFAKIVIPTSRLSICICRKYKGSTYSQISALSVQRQRSLLSPPMARPPMPCKP